MHQIIHPTITGTSFSLVGDSSVTEVKRARLAQARAVVIAQFGAAILVPPIARSQRTSDPPQLARRADDSETPTTPSRAIAHAAR